MELKLNILVELFKKNVKFTNLNLLNLICLITSQFFFLTVRVYNILRFHFISIPIHKEKFLKMLFYVIIYVKVTLNSMINILNLILLFLLFSFFIVLINMRIFLSFTPV